MSESKQHDITIVGNIGSAPKFTGNRCNFSVAVYAGKDKAGDKLTKWFNVTAWDIGAEAMEQYGVGQRVQVFGRLNTWYNRDDEEQLSIIMDGILPAKFVGGGKKKAAAKKSAAKKPPAEKPGIDLGALKDIDLGDDIPF